MTLSKIHYMNVIPDAGTVRSVIIIAEYLKLFQLSQSYLRYIRNKIIWYTVRVFSDKTALMRADRIKVP